MEVDIPALHSSKCVDRVLQVPLKKVGHNSYRLRRQGASVRRFPGNWCMLHPSFAPKLPTFVAQCLLIDSPITCEGGSPEGWLERVDPSGVSLLCSYYALIRELIVRHIKLNKPLNLIALLRNTNVLIQ